jgi:cytochrome c551/c552
MRMKKLPVMRCLFALVLALAAWPLAAEIVQIKLPPETASFKPGPGSEIANGQCLTCHSVEYVVTQPPMPLSAWTAEVKKMRKVYGATIPENQIAPLAEYLARTYGTGTNLVAPAVASTTPAETPGVPLDGKAVAEKYGCLTCHHVNEKVVGPSYKAVADKYSKDPNAYARIAEQIHKGGSGKWGSVIMPPFPTVSPAEVKALASWILSCK